jgi:hypothetical protein
MSHVLTSTAAEFAWIFVFLAFFAILCSVMYNYVELVDGVPRYRVKGNFGSIDGGPEYVYDAIVKPADKVDRIFCLADNPTIFHDMRH